MAEEESPAQIRSKSQRIRISGKRSFMEDLLEAVLQLIICFFDLFGDVIGLLLEYWANASSYNKQLLGETNWDPESCASLKKLCARMAIFFLALCLIAWWIAH